MVFESDADDLVAHDANQTGDVFARDLIEPDDGIVGIGSGGMYAVSAAKALARHTSLDARQIAEAAMAIAADICIYTNTHFTFEEL